MGIEKEVQSKKNRRKKRLIQETCTHNGVSPLFQKEEKRHAWPQRLKTTYRNIYKVIHHLRTNNIP